MNSLHESDLNLLIQIIIHAACQMPMMISSRQKKYGDGALCFARTCENLTGWVPVFSFGFDTRMFSAVSSSGKSSRCACSTGRTNGSTWWASRLMGRHLVPKDPLQFLVSTSRDKRTLDWRGPAWIDNERDGSKIEFERECQVSFDYTSIVRSSYRPLLSHHFALDI